MSVEMSECKNGAKRKMKKATRSMRKMNTKNKCDEKGEKE